MSTYHIIYGPEGSPSIIRDADGGFIPNAPSNADFRAFLVWNASQMPPLDYTTNGPKARKPRPIADIRADLLGLTPGQKKKVLDDLQMRLMAEYVQRNPGYLAASPVDPSVNIDGSMPG